MGDREEFTIGAARVQEIRELAGDALGSFLAGVHAASGDEPQEVPWHARFKRLAQILVRDVHVTEDELVTLLFVQGFIAGRGSQGATTRQAYDAMGAICERRGIGRPQMPFEDNDPEADEVVVMNLEELDRPPMDHAGIRAALREFAEKGVFEMEDMPIIDAFLELTDDRGFVRGSFKKTVKRIVLRTSRSRAHVERALNRLHSLGIIDGA